MSTKMTSIISSVVTALLVLVIVIVLGFGGLVLLNGFMNASIPLYTGFACLGITLILCPILAGILTKNFIAKFKWNNILSILISVFVSTLLGAGMGIASTFVMIIVAETIWRS
jgi:hypothetical protein